MSQSRSIFEDVNETTKTAPNVPRAQGEKVKIVTVWLWILFALIVTTVLIGGATRLTDSGLSITEWDLFTGFLPPMTDSAWVEQFSRYQMTEEFKQINYTMTVEAFRSIFWWEWIHRFLGRIIGLFFIGGFAFFAIRKKIRRDRLLHIIYIGAMIGLQGVVGILMVKSGYVGDRTDVASYALATHLGIAFIILAQIFWNIKILKVTPDALVEMRRRGDQGRARFAKVLAGFVFLQIILGALVAGIDGGLSYNDWPLMGGEFFSSDAFALSPWWRNFFENSALVQFFHRMNGYLLFALAVWLFVRTRRAPYKQWKMLGLHVMIAVMLQVILGIVVLVRLVPLPEALMHQVFAIAIWIAVFSAIFAFRFPRPQSVRGK